MIIVKDKKEEFASYLEDTANFRGDASLLYLPKAPAEVAYAVRECLDKNTPFTAQAARTGTTAGCVPLEGAIISLEKLDKIIDIDPKNKVARLQAGVSLEALERSANKLGLTLPASPTESLALLGGVLATSASGVRGFGYGSIRDYVLALEVVLPGREPFEVKRGQFTARKRVFDFTWAGRQFKFALPSYQLPQAKSQAGYFVKDDMDLVDLFVGSEGTLGIITACAIQLGSLPFAMLDGLLFFTQESGALRFTETVKELKMKGGLVPVSLEFFDKNALDFLRPHYSFVPAPASCAVYFEQPAQSPEDLDSLIERWAELAERDGVLPESIFADSPRERAKIFEFRHRLPQEINESLRHSGQVKAAGDIAVPSANFGKMYDFYKQTAESLEVPYVNFGHIGESHLHFNFLPQNQGQAQAARQALMKFCRQAVSWGGTVSAEHGIGKIKKPYLEIMYDQGQIKEMAALKKQFDPRGLLGRDNIFASQLLDEA